MGLQFNALWAFFKGFSCPLWDCFNSSHLFKFDTCNLRFPPVVLFLEPEQFTAEIVDHYINGIRRVNYMLLALGILVGLKAA